MRYDPTQVDAAFANFGGRANRDLTASAELVEQGALAGGRQAGRAIVEECQMLPGLRIASTDFNTQGSLPRSRTHYLAGDNLFYQSGLSQTVKPRRSKDDRVVFSLFEFAKAGIDVAAQGVNFKIGANRFQLCLAAKAAGADPCPLRKTFDTRNIFCEQNTSRGFSRVVMAAISNSGESSVGKSFKL